MDVSDTKKPSRRRRLAKWREEALASGSKRTLQLFYQEAARAEKWQILVEDGQHLLLLLHGQFRLFGKACSILRPKRKNTGKTAAAVRAFATMRPEL